MKLSGWGRYPRIRAEGCCFGDLKVLRECLERDGDRIVYGLGRSYGDSALNAKVLFSGKFNRILDFDPSRGVVVCEAGVTLEDLIRVFLPRGWFLKVTPGTKYVTVGGAVASDVHGKNHHGEGTFTESVLELELLLPDGSAVRCDREENRELFLATCGGMGLTGVILTATLKLRPVQSAYIRETVLRAENLEEVFALFERHRSATYSVAWIDCLAEGRTRGRSLLMLGEHADSGRLALPAPSSRSVPFSFPRFALNRRSVALFNHFYYNRSPAPVEGRLVHLDSFFYPLDAILHWNRMYGRKGFTQYQLALPAEGAFDGLREVLRRVSRWGLGSFLAVLKALGPANDNLLSFPLEGYTLALDFKIQRKLFPLLEELDRIVLDYGGRLYLAKDARMSAAVFRRGYPRWEEFARLRESRGMKKKLNSLQSARLGV